MHGPGEVRRSCVVAEPDSTRSDRSETGWIGWVGDTAQLVGLQVSGADEVGSKCDVSHQEIV